MQKVLRRPAVATHLSDDSRDPILQSQACDIVAYLYRYKCGRRYPFGRSLDLCVAAFTDEGLVLQPIEPKHGTREDSAPH